MVDCNFLLGGSVGVIAKEAWRNNGRNERTNGGTKSTQTKVLWLRIRSFKFLSLLNINHFSFLKIYTI
jgi:hypothetical protein